jgi:hypothetical protein
MRLEHRQRWHLLTVIAKDESFANDREREVGKWSEVTRRTNRSLRWHCRQNAVVEHRDQVPDDLWPYTGMPL